MSHKILIVDDESLQRKMIRQVLERRGFVVKDAWNGIQALEIADKWQPDLIITDVIMPELDGFGFVKELRAKQTSVLTPVIFLSAQSEAEYRVRGFKLGADDYLPKPFYPEELYTRVERVLEKIKNLKKEVDRRWSVEIKAIPRQEVQPSVPDLTGDLTTLGIATLLTVIEMKSRSGVLSVTHDDANALLEFANGRVVAAQLDAGETSTNHREAIYTLLTWETGRFVFKALAIDTEDKIGMSHQALMMEAARRIDEQSK